MKALFPNIVGCLAVGLAVTFAGAQDGLSVPKKPGEDPKADANRSPERGTRPAIDATDNKSDASASAEELAKSAEAARQETKRTADGDDEEVKIFRLKRADATATCDLVLEMYPAEFRNRSKIAADARTNTLVVRGPRDLLNLIEAVLLQLDETESAKRPERKGVRDAQNKSEAIGEVIRSRPASARENWVADLQTAADPDAQVARMNEEFRRQEQQAAALARQYQQGQASASPDDADLKKRKAALRGTVEAAFDARQKVQWYELEQLRRRLDRIESRLTSRERNEQAIVRQRIEQLLHPDRDWEPANDAVNLTVAPGDSSAENSTGTANEANASTDSARQIGSPNRPAPDSVWMTDFKMAAERARERYRPLLIHFTAKWSAPCRQMEREVLYDPEVLQLLERNFVAVRADVDSANDLQKAYNIESVPTDLILDLEGLKLRGAGHVFVRTTGVQTREAFVKLLRDSVDKLASENSKIRGTAPDKQSLKAAPEPSPGVVTNPRKDLLDAEWALIAARAEVVAGEKKCQLSQSQLERTRKLHDSGVIPENSLRAAERDFAIDDSQLEKAKLDLEHAEAQAELARETLASQRKLLELDMANAKLRIAHLADDETRARRLIESKAMSQSEYDEKKLALEQAQVQLSRIMELLDLYAKPIPGVERTAPTDQKLDKPDAGSAKRDPGTKKDDDSVP